MCPGRSFSPSFAAVAGKAPARERIFGSKLGPVGEVCKTMAMAAGRPRGSPRTRRLRASTPPAEAPTTMTSG